MVFTFQTASEVLRDKVHMERDFLLMVIGKANS